MSELMRYAAMLEDAAQRPLPPVEKWNPAYSGELDLIIRGDGVWLYQGAPIARARLVRLFSTVLRREGDRFFLVTPVEKLGIKVEDAPFTAVFMRAEGAGEEQLLIFTTNVGDIVAAGPDHAIEYRVRAGGGEKAPYIHVRAGLQALIVRSVFYDLVALGETRETDSGESFGVYSSGAFFPFGPASEIFGEGASPPR